MQFIIILFAVLLIMSAYWHVSQNKKLLRQFHDEMDKETAVWFSQFAWSRTLQLMLALSAGLLASIAYHWQIQQADDRVNAMSSDIQAKLEEIAIFQQKHAQLQPAQPQAASATLPAPSQPFPADSTPQSMEDQMQGDIPPVRIPQIAVTAPALTDNDPPLVVGPAPQGIPDSPANVTQAESAKVPASEIADNTDTPLLAEQPSLQPAGIEAVYNPEEIASDKQSEMDAIKKRYESLLVNYLFLKKCGLINVQDYHTIISTLAREMSSVNAPGRMEHDIMTAAHGSYKELYEKSSCTGPEITQLHAQYSDYIKTISQHIPEP